jgi:prepilin signal peptidase PulO-like enzyme (type II secretory pathway)
MSLILLFFIFALGLIIGSFLNVLIYRTIHGESPWTGRSRCDHCEKQINWYDNIPLLSYVLLRGKCRYCKEKISGQHVAIELMTGALFVWWYMVGFAFFQLTQEPFTILQPLFWLMVGIFLLIIFVTDWLYQIIPDYATICLGVLALSYRLYLSISGIMQWRDFWQAILAGFLMMGILWFLWWVTKGRGMGFGDVKFALVMGWLLGFERSLVAFFLAFVLGAIVGVGLIVMGRKKMGSKIAFGPFLVLATLLSLMFGNQLWGWYMGMIL